MRQFLISVAILSLVGGTSLAMAQDHGRDGRDGGPRDSGNPGGEAHSGGPASHAGGPTGGAPRAAPQAESRPAPQAAPNPAAASGRNGIGERQLREHHDAPSPTRAATPTPNAVGGNNAARGGNNPPGANNGFRGNPGPGQNFNRPGGQNNAVRGNSGPRHDFSSTRNFHQNFRANQRFRGPAYRRPQGWYSHRWTWGETLPISFWARDYWLDDFGAYDLPPPPYGAVWVRVGSDALLIDQDSGEIIEVDYGVFY